MTKRRTIKPPAVPSKVVPMAAPMEKPRVEIRIVWPKLGSHSTACQRIGAGIAALIEQSKEKRERESSYYSSGYTETVEHFTITSRHEVEP